MTFLLDNNWFPIKRSYNSACLLKLYDFLIKHVFSPCNVRSRSINKASFAQKTLPQHCLSQVSALQRQARNIKPESEIQNLKSKQKLVETQQTL